mmetsp:Transcript_75780/g.211751  ORF Transcript_75780/g.211751 Transcript_75780/m.211751 type:complete len:428 (+) Transcript_75780:156-1439(+)
MKRGGGCRRRQLRRRRACARALTGVGSAAAGSGPLLLLPLLVLLGLGLLRLMVRLDELALLLQCHAPVLAEQGVGIVLPRELLPRRRAGVALVRRQHPPVDADEVRVGEHLVLPSVLLAELVHQDLPSELAVGDLLPDLPRELLYRGLQLVEEPAEVAVAPHLSGLLDAAEQLPHAGGPPLHVLHLQRGALEAAAGGLVLLHGLLELPLRLLSGLEDLAAHAARLVEGDALRLPLDGLELLPERLQVHLGVLHGALELLVLVVPVQELVHDVHDVREASHLADFLEPVLGLLRMLHLLYGGLLQLVARQLLYSTELPKPAGRVVERLVRGSEGHLFPPLVEAGSALVGGLPALELSAHHLAGLRKSLPLLIHVDLEGFQLVLLDHPVLLRALHLVPLLNDLLALAAQVLLHLQHLLLENGLLLLHAG